MDKYGTCRRESEESLIGGEGLQSGLKHLSPWDSKG